MMCACAGGCMVGPNHFVPKTDALGDWRHLHDADITDEPADLAAWWLAFDDPVLNGLMEQAIEQNLTLREASLRILEARMTRGSVRGNMFPTLDADGSYRYQRFSTSGSQFNFFGGGSRVRIDNTADAWSLGLNASWEVDVFGRLKRGVEAADADVCSAIWAYRDAQVIMLADVASNYVDARTFQRRLEIARNNLQTQTASLKLTQQRFDADIINELDVAQAKANASSTEAEIPNLQAGYQQAVNRINLLLGQPPGFADDLLAESSAVPSPSSIVAIGIPAELLRRRPDVRQAEFDLAAQTARVGVAVGDLYPQFSIAGGFGLDSVDLSQLFTRPAANANIGPSVRWNVLNFGRVKFNIRSQEARRSQNFVVYERTVLEAAHEVDNALVSYQREKERQDALRETVTAYRRAVSISEQQYEQGTTNFQRVLDSQRSLLQFEDQLALSEANVSINLIQLYRTLGGGWETPRIEQSADDFFPDVIVDPEEIPVPEPVRIEPELGDPA